MKCVTVRVDSNHSNLFFHLMRFGSLGHKAPSVEVDEQPGGEGLLLHPGELGHGDGGRISSRERHQLLTVLK